MLITIAVIFLRGKVEGVESSLPGLNFSSEIGTLYVTQDRKHHRNWFVFADCGFSPGGMGMEIQIGKVTHFYSRICVAVLQLSGEINKGDLVHFLGYNTDFIQPVRSMEIDHQPVRGVKAGTEVALKVLRPVRKGDLIYKVPSTEVDQVTLEGPIYFETER